MCPGCRRRFPTQEGCYTVLRGAENAPVSWVCRALTGARCSNGPYVYDPDVRGYVAIIPDAGQALHAPSDLPKDPPSR